MWIYANGNMIGGSEAGSGNVISGNCGNGIYIWGQMINETEYNSSNNIIQGNLMGTDYSGLKPIGNELNGITLGHYSGDNLIGGNEKGMGNIIAFNKIEGVSCVGNRGNVYGNSILANSIHSNGGLGINLGDDGVTENDDGDTDTGRLIPDQITCKTTLLLTL